ncbi:thioredoxin family protein [soil metagenome]
MRRFGPVRTLLLAVSVILAFGSAAAAAPVKAPHVDVELVPQGQATPGGEVYVALRLKVEDGWHTFWRNPGDAGEPTRLVWTLPAGWKAGPFVWPRPKLFPVGPLMNYVLTGDVILPVPLSVPTSAKPGTRVTLKAEAVYQVCSDVCVPGQETVTLEMPVVAAPAPDPKWSGPILKVIGEAPKAAGLSAAFAATGPSVKLAITGDPLKGADFKGAWFFPYDSTQFDHAKPEPAEYGPDGVTFTLPGASAFTGGGPPPAKVEGILALGNAAYEVEALHGPMSAGAAGLGVVKTVAASGGEGGAGAASLPLWQAIVFAFLGGLILNLMPCVFPVLSMKAASLAQHAHEGDKARAQGIAFLVGVLATFLALAGGLIAAKAAGSAVGWGFQLQSPPVVAALCLLMLLVALNLAGLFEIGLSAQGVGSDLASKSGLAGAFFTGALAVVVAAPCTAPFMGAALGYALGQPAVIALAVFTALGLGFALPFTAVAFAPGLLRRLPRPGAWMNVFKTVLAFPMLGAAAWLGWVFAVQAGVDALPFLFGAALLTAFGAWLFGQGQYQQKTTPKYMLQAALPLALIGSALLLAPVSKAQPADAGASGALSKTAVPHEVWTPERLAALRAEGRPVFVDFTAAWCVTCKVNEGAALSNQAFADTLAKTNTAYLVADWTNRDAVIAKALADFGRVGVPLYLVYPASGGDAVVLPQLLTPGLVRSAIEKAAKT